MRVAPLRLTVLSLLAVAAVLGPWVAGTPRAPSVGASAAQLLPPGTRVEEVSLRGGGFARAREIRVAEHGVALRSDRGWRAVPGAVAARAPRVRRLWLGSDQQGRSLLARTLAGARVSLATAVVATATALALGATLGLLAALASSPLGALIEITSDAALGLPRLLLLFLLGTTLGGSAVGLALAIGLGSWMEVCRLVQSEARALLRRPFVAAAHSSGMRPAALATRHLLPNLGVVLGVTAPLVATEAVLLESTLSFLGVAGGAGASSWGRIVADGRRLLPEGWWIAVFPGVLLCITAIAMHGAAGTSSSARARRTSPRRDQNS